MSTERVSKAAKMYDKEVEGVGYKIVYVDAKRAEEMLERNKANRPRTAAAYKQYTEAILMGDFHFNGEAKVIVDRKDSVQNGQHTLYAIIEAQKLLDKAIKAEDAKEKYPAWAGVDRIQVPLTVCRGIDPNVADTIDLGKSRTVSDILFRQRLFSKHLTPAIQKKLHTFLATALRLCWNRMNGQTLTSRKRFTQQSAEALLEMHPDIVKAVCDIWELDTTDDDKRLIERVCSPALCAGMLYLFATSKTTEDDLAAGNIDISRWERAVAFFKKFATGQGEADEPAVRARRKIEELPKGSKDRDTVCNVLAICWQAYISNQRIEAKTLSSTLRKSDAAAVRVGGLDVELKKEEPDHTDAEESAAAEEEVVEVTEEEQAA